MIGHTMREDFSDYFDSQALGVFTQDVFNTLRRIRFSTGVPAFLGV